MNGHHIALDIEFDRIGVHPGQIELHHQLFAVAPRVHRHGRRPRRGAEDLLRQTVEIAERIGAHQHCLHLQKPET